MSDASLINPLKSYREERGLSQQELAAQLDVSRQLVGLLETGAREFTAAMCVRIEERLGIDRAKCRPDLFQRGDIQVTPE